MLSQEDNELLTRTGPGTPMGTLLRRYWLPAMLSEELPAPDGEPVRLKLLGETLIAFRDSSGRVGLLDAYCPHRGAQLFWGRNEEDGLRCVYHGWKFDVRGACVDMPSEPAASNFRDKVRTTAYQVREAGGVVWAYMGPPELTPELPQMEWMLVPESHRYVHKRFQECNYLQNVEGEIDSAHVSFLHRSFVERELSVSGQGLLASTADAAPVFHVRETPYGMMVGARRDRPDQGDHYWRLTQFLMPAYTMIPSEPGGVVNFTGAVPMDDEHMWGYTVAWHPHRPLNEAEIASIESWDSVYTELIPGTYLNRQNKTNDYLIDREKQRTQSYTGIKGVRGQDLPVQEDQWGPVSQRQWEHLGTSDLAIIKMRQRLLREVRALQDGVEPPEPHDGASYAVRSGAFVAPQDAVWYDYPEMRDWLFVTR